YVPEFDMPFDGRHHDGGWRLDDLTLLVEDAGENPVRRRERLLPRDVDASEVADRPRYLLQEVDEHRTPTGIQQALIGSGWQFCVSRNLIATDNQYECDADIPDVLEDGSQLGAFL